MSRKRGASFVHEVDLATLCVLISFKRYLIAQMFKRSKTLYYPKGKIIADGRDSASGMMVITQGSVSVELPLDSDEADEQMGQDNSVALYTLGRGYCALYFSVVHEFRSMIVQVGYCPD